MDERMQRGNQNQQAPWNGGGRRTMPDNLRGGVSNQGEPLDSIQQAQIHYPAPHLNPNFFYNIHSVHQHQYRHHLEQLQQQPQVGMSNSSAFVRVGGAGWQPMYYPRLSATNAHGFNGYHVPVQNYAAGGPPPSIYANPFGLMNGNPPGTASTSYVPLPTYPNPFQAPPPQFQLFPTPLNLSDDPRKVHSGETNLEAPSSTSSPKLWPRSSSSPQQAEFPTLSPYERQGAQTSPALPKQTGATSRKAKVERGSPSELRTPKAEPEKIPRVRAKILVGRRRGGSKVLPTGLIKRTKEPEATGADGSVAEGPETKWSRYMIEVEQYRRQTCSDEKQIRPLVK